MGREVDMTDEEFRRCLLRYKPQKGLEEFPFICGNPYQNRQQFILSNCIIWDMYVCVCNRVTILCGNS